MDRRCFVLMSLAGVFAAPLAAQAEDVRKLSRIGIEGETLHIQLRRSDGDVDSLARLARNSSGRRST